MNSSAKLDWNGLKCSWVILWRHKRIWMNLVIGILHFVHPITIFETNNLNTYKKLDCLKKQNFDIDKTI